MAKKSSKSKKKPVDKAIECLNRALDVCIEKINEKEPHDAIKLRWIHALSQTYAALSNLSKLQAKDADEDESWIDTILAEAAKERDKLAKRSQKNC